MAKRVDILLDKPIKSINIREETLEMNGYVKVVRCKDCKWFRNCPEYKVCGISPIHHPIRFDNDFCSMGERREQ